MRGMAARTSVSTEIAIAAPRLDVDTPDHRSAVTFRLSDFDRGDTRLEVEHAGQGKPLHGQWVRRGRSGGGASFQ